MSENEKECEQGTYFTGFNDEVILLVHLPITVLSAAPLDNALSTKGTRCDDNPCLNAVSIALIETHKTNAIPKDTRIQFICFSPEFFRSELPRLLGISVI